MKMKQGFFARIDERLARLAIIEKHYLHRPCPISWAWGIIVEEKLKGVLTIGRPCSRTVCEGVCGKERSADVYELNRLWLDEGLPCNSESRFIGWCLRELRKINRRAILVSYADTKPSEGAPKGHLGIIYQSTNWVYTGTSTPFADRAHGQMIERSTKHRYVFFLNATDKKLLQWQVRPYPKRSKKGTCGEKAHLKSTCRFEFLPYTEPHTESEVTAATFAPVVSFDDASVRLGTV
ncbi:MAG: hypothetical protein ABSG23_09040 [Terriglobales bacterium]